MSTSNLNNNTLNAILAYIKGRPEHARAFLRGPEMKDVDIATVGTAIEIALDDIRQEIELNTLRRVLRSTLQISVTGPNAEQNLIGITAVEMLIEKMIEDCNESRV